MAWVITLAVGWCAFILVAIALFQTNEIGARGDPLDEVGPLTTIVRAE